MNNKTRHIMLADDDDDDRMLFKMALDDIDKQIELTTAEDGEMLMDMLHSALTKLPQILFLDLNMPFKNGKECLKEIRSNQAFDDMPVVIYSTSYSDIDIDQTYNLGANLYLEKPVFSKLKLALSKIIQLDWSLYQSPDKSLYLSMEDKYKSILH